MPDDYLPLEEKIHVFFKDEVAFTVADIERKFPDEHVRAIYRAVDKLVKTNRIKYLRHVNRKKVYTAMGQSNLPMIRTNNGDVVPISALINAMPALFDESTGRFKQDEVDRTFILMCQLFVLAQEPNRQDFLEAHKLLIKYREFFVRMLENIDSLLRHPAMSGNLDLFKRTFASTTDPAVPSAEDLLKFRTWLAKLGR